MTEAVATQGFAVPGQPNIPPAPSDQHPGFVNPIAPALTPIAPAAPAPAAPVAPAAPTDALAAAVAALTAAMAPPAPAADQAPADSLNALDPATIDDPTLRSMAGAFKMIGKGLDYDRIFAKAIDSGDPNLLDLAYLREKAGDQAEGLVGLAESIVNLINSNAEKATSAIYTLAGGEAQWNAATAAFNAKAPPELKLAIKQLIDSGKEANVAAGAKLVVQFAQGQGYVPTQAGLLNAGAGNPSGAALDKAGFIAALQKLNPNAPDYSVRRGELFAQRALGKQLGK